MIPFTHPHARCSPPRGPTTRANALTQRYQGNQGSCPAGVLGYRVIYTPPAWSEHTLKPGGKTRGPLACRTPGPPVPVPVPVPAVGVGVGVGEAVASVPGQTLSSVPRAPALPPPPASPAASLCDTLGPPPLPAPPPPPPPLLSCEVRAATPVVGSPASQSSSWKNSCGSLPSLLSLALASVIFGSLGGFRKNRFDPT